MLVEVERNQKNYSVVTSIVILAPLQTTTASSSGLSANATDGLECNPLSTGVCIDRSF